MKQYKYTLLNQDGTIKELEPCAKKDFRELYKLLNCRTIEIIPRDYYQKEWGRCTVFGDEEGRFNSGNIRNPHTQVLNGDEDEWDCVGNLIKEEVYKGEKSA